MPGRKLLSFTSRWWEAIAIWLEAIASRLNGHYRSIRHPFTSFYFFGLFIDAPNRGSFFGCFLQVCL